MTMAPENAHIQLQGVVKRFGSTIAVAGVSLDVARGSLTTVLGPSGCGKTTLLRLIAGFVEAEEGDILIGGESQRGLPPYLRKTSTVFQEYALFPHMSVFDNVAYGLRLRRLPRAGVAEKVRRTLGLMQLEGLEKRLPRELSGGQQQRVALARSLVVEPEVLLMDEPLSNLDAKLRVSVRSEIREIQERVGITTLYVTHDQEEALAISDTIAVMQSGRVMQVGSPREIYDRPADPFVAAFVGQVNLLSAIVDADGVRLGSLAFPLPPEAPPIKPGSRVLLALRPEAIRIGAGSDGRKELTGRIVSVTYLGPTVRYRIELAGQRLTVDDPDPAGRPLLQGQITLAFDPARMRLWPATAEGLNELGENTGSRESRR
jgi:putative spermidine/putrescine transport system ATP-binding protein